MGNETVTIQLEKTKGYSGNRSGKSYIARLNGTDKQFIFKREFIETEAADKAEMFGVRRKGKGSWMEAAAVEPGLYEKKTCGGDVFFIVVFKNVKKENNVEKCTIEEERAIKMCCLMDDGASFEEAREKTKKPASVAADVPAVTAP